MILQVVKYVGVHIGNSQKPTIGDCYLCHVTQSTICIRIGEVSLTVNFMSVGAQSSWPRSEERLMAAAIFRLQFGHRTLNDHLYGTIGSCS